MGSAKSHAATNFVLQIKNVWIMPVLQPVPIFLLAHLAKFVHQQGLAFHQVVHPLLVVLLATLAQFIELVC